ncbi:MAG: hypothetical protein RMI91_13770 [Gemmatales bacterium]|nr:hypothetical protein [Gemmatales bacterium]MDW7995713.1 hypothetical protein [Gemmatales bacterium]
MESEEAIPTVKQQLWAQCDCCQAEFLLDLELLGQTVQCGQCRNYFVVTPISPKNQSNTPDSAPTNAWILARAHVHLLPRAWLHDWQEQTWYVRYPAGWWEVLHFLLALVVLMIWGYLLLVALAVLGMSLQAGNFRALVKIMPFVILLVVGMYPLALWQQASIPQFRIVVDAGTKRVGQPILEIRPASFWVSLFGGWWVIETKAGDVLARLRRPFWLIRWFSRLRWRVRIPGWKHDLVVTETFWLPEWLRWLILLPLGLLGLAFFLVPFFFRPLRPNYQVRLARSSYILAQSHVKLGLLNTTEVHLAQGVEQLFDKRVLLALAAVLHAGA